MRTILYLAAAYASILDICRYNVQNVGMHEGETANSNSWLSFILSRIGFIIIAIIVIWGLVHIFSLVRDGVSSYSNGRSSSPSTYASKTGTDSTTKQLPGHTSNNKYVRLMAQGTPRLAITIMSVGVIDPNTGTISNRAPASPGDIEAVQFNIANIGDGTSGAYYFDARLPVQNGPNNSYEYRSSLQAPLAPGEHIVNTLKFSSAARGGGIFTVSIENGTGQAASQFISSAY